MRKIRLAVDALSIESFEPAPEREAPKGTVMGRDASELGDTCMCTGMYDYTCHVNTCAAYATCGGYPEYTCDYTCEGVGYTCQHCE